jgi:CRP/FNR family cyclic AMP-dependent transcriptional regulator
MALTTARKADLLAAVDLFAGLERPHLEAVAERAQERDFKPGAYIARQGEIGTGLYLIVRGRARVLRGGEQIADVGPGEFVGEISVLDHEPRLANVVAAEATSCLALASWELDQVLQAEPSVALALLRGLARRFRIVSGSERG